MSNSIRGNTEVHLGLPFFFLILDFHPILSLIDLLLLLGGPLYNKRLRKQLRLLSDGDMVVIPEQRQEAIVGFRGVRSGVGKFEFPYQCGKGDVQQFIADIEVETR